MKQKTLSEFIEISARGNTNFEALFKKIFSRYFSVRFEDIEICEFVICRKCRKIGYAIAKVVRKECEKKIVGSDDLKYCLVLKKINISERIVDIGFRIIDDNGIIIDKGITSHLFFDGICPFCRDRET